MQGLIAFAEDLEKIESIDNHVKELELQRDNLLKDVDKIKESRANEQLAFEAKLSELKAESDKKLSEADELLKDKIQKCDNHLALVKAEAAAIKQNAEKQLSAAQDGVQELQKQSEVIKEEIESEQKRLDVIKAEIARIKEL